MGGCTFKRKALFATTSLKKGGGHISRVGLFSGDYGILKRYSKLQSCSGVEEYAFLFATYCKSGNFRWKNFRVEKFS